MAVQPLAANSTIGILGGGQLGRMLALAAARLGLDTHIYCPDPDSPAFRVAAASTVAAYDDEAALARFADSVDVVTYEFENVPAATAALIGGRVTLRPTARALAVSQDRLAEKAFLSELGIAVAPYRAVTSQPELEAAIAALGLPAVLKTTRMGYDGKGQAVLRAVSDGPAALATLAPHPLVLEGFVAFEREISVVVARGVDGAVAPFTPAENVHRDGILRTSTVPAAIEATTSDEAQAIAASIATALDYVGVLGVEFFVTAGGRLLVNEIAPRVHNSGHWTEAVCITDQFEQHVRAICGWPLGDPSRLADVVMENLIGDEADRITELAARGQLHLYGKAESQPGRKMGHLNRVGARNGNF